MLEKLFHVNVCVRDMERSIGFYEKIGFNKVNDFTLEDPTVRKAVKLLGLDARKSEEDLRVRGVFMRLGDDENAPVLDLVQFIDPPPQGQPYPSLNNIGICRIAFRQGSAMWTISTRPMLTFKRWRFSLWLRSKKLKDRAAQR